MLSLEELQEHDVRFHPSNVTMLLLDCIPAASNYSSFLNALFWTCHPTRMVVLMNQEETLNSPHRNGFIRVSVCVCVYKLVDEIYLYSINLHRDILIS